MTHETTLKPTWGQRKWTWSCTCGDGNATPRTYALVDRDAREHEDDHNENPDPAE